MKGLDYMLDQFVVKWDQMVFGYRIQKCPNPTSDQSTCLSTLVPDILAQGSGRRIKRTYVVYVSVSVYINTHK